MKFGLRTPLKIDGFPPHLKQMNILLYRLKHAVLAPCAVLLGACSNTRATKIEVASTRDIGATAIFTVVGANNRSTARAITRAATCPLIAYDGQSAQSMTVRAPAQTIALRGSSAQTDSKEAVFDVLICESEWPASAKGAKIDGQPVPAPKQDIQRIVIVSDTGCRMKASDNAFQACNDGKKWPWAQVAISAAATKPDLVIHIGDIHYRESPCPLGNIGCAASPWGYGYDTWAADLFNPAKALLETAPWVFVRGNHESCLRAGQGWFRFVDSQPFIAGRSCNDAKLDEDADYSNPYAVSISPQTQLLVFDSSKTSGKPYAAKDPAFTKYTTNLTAVNALTKQKSQSLFLSHHPLLAIAAGKGTDRINPGGTGGLLSVFEASQPGRLMPEGVSVAMHGHLHYFESLSFKTDHATSLIMGNSGSVNDGSIPTQVPDNTAAHPGAIIADYAATAEYGFATLDRVVATSNWVLTEYTAAGKPVFRCAVDGGKSKCVKVD